MTDFTRLTRTEWLDLADRFYRHLNATCAGLTASAWERPTAYLGWRAREVLAHMTSAMPVNFREVLGRALADNPPAPREFDTFPRNAPHVRSRARPRSEARAALRAARSRRRRMAPDGGR